MKKTLILMTALFMAVSFAVAQITPIDEKTVEVRSTGRGMNTEEAKADALVNAVDSVVLDMLTMTEEQMKYQTSKEAVLANALNYQVGGAKINGKITAKRTQEFNGKKFKVSMTLTFKLNTEQIRKDLEMMGIIASSKDLRKQLDNFSIMPYVDEKTSDPAFYKRKDLAYAKIGSFLQNQHIPFIGEQEIKEIEANEELINLEKSAGAMETGEEDMMLTLARNTNADFYIKVVGDVEEAVSQGMSAVKVSISISAYTVMTGENIASQTGYSRPLTLSSKDASISAGMEEAINSAMGDIMNKLRLFWKDYVADGRPYKLVFYDYSFGEIGSIRRVLKDMTNQIKLGTKAGNVTSFTVWYDGQLDDLLFEIPGRMELNLKEDPIVLGNTIRFFREAQ